MEVWDRVRDRVSGRVRVRACRPVSSEVAACRAVTVPIAYGAHFIKQLIGHLCRDVIQ